jgi:ATP-dependent Clp protease ATP-binding subunit ClpC
VFERFTERARQVVVLAQDEARELRHNYIGTEHLLLGLLREQEGVAARVLDELGVTLVETRTEVLRIVGVGDEIVTGQAPFAPRAKEVLELASRESLDLGHNYIGTEHLLLALVRLHEGVAARILLDAGTDAGLIRDAVIRILEGPGGQTVHSIRAESARVRRPRGPRRWGRTSPAALLVTGWLLFAGALGVGILVGWGIWGH